MSGSLFGYFGIGLRALNAARLGIDVAGNNIANVNTPGYARRRLELTTGPPIRMQNHVLDQGVDVGALRRVEDRFLQATLEREQGGLANSRERLRGLGDLESAFGTLDGEGLLSAYSAFSGAFGALAATPSDAGLRSGAIVASEALAGRFRDTYRRVEAQRHTEDRRIEQAVIDINALAGQLDGLNRKIAGEEADGNVASGLRDQRDRVLGELVELTGGSAITSGNKLGFQLAGGPTLVSGDNALKLGTTRGTDGLLRIVDATGADITDGLREGEVGALLELRDDEIPARLDELDTLASDLITRANALTTAGTDAGGAPGGPLFVPDPPAATGSARDIRVAADVAADSQRLAVSAGGASGDGSIAIALSELQSSASAGLGGRTPSGFVADVVSTIGNRVVEADVATAVSQEVVGSLENRRDELTGVSLDEEAIELIRSQRAYEAAARFMSVINEITEIAVNLG